MEQYSQHNYFNLPIIQISELESIDIWYDPTSTEKSEFEQFSQAIIEKYPLIKSFMSHDFDVWYLESQDADNISDDNLKSRFLGMEYGYIFVLGLYSKINMISNDVNSVDELISMGENCPGLTPIIDDKSLEKIKRARLNQDFSEIDLLLIKYKGQAWFDEMARNRKSLADKHFDELIELDPIFKNLYFQFGRNAALFLDANPCIEPSESCYFLEGYKHGVKQAIEMYIQSYESINFRDFESGVE